MDMTMNLVIWPESQCSSYMIVHYVKNGFSKVGLIQVWYFSCKLVHIKGLRAKWLHFFKFPSYSFAFSQNGVKIVGTAIHTKGPELVNTLTGKFMNPTWVPQNDFLQLLLPN
jgi:hypothetical protein